MLWLQAVLTAFFFATSYNSPGIFIILLLSTFLYTTDSQLKLPSLLIVSVLFLIRSKIKTSYFRNLLLILVTGLLFFFSKAPYPHQQVNWDEYTTTINQFRGEHTLLGLPLGRVFHNKLSLLFLFLSHSLSAINPSVIFGVGDTNPESLSLRLSPLPITFLLLLLLSKFSTFPRFVPWLLITWIFAALQNHYLYESTLVFFYLFLSLACGLAFDRLAPKTKVVFLVLTILYLSLAWNFYSQIHV